MIKLYLLIKVNGASHFSCAFEDANSFHGHIGERLVRTECDPELQLTGSQYE